MTGLAEVLQPIVRSPSSASLGIDLGCNNRLECGTGLDSGIASSIVSCNTCVMRLTDVLNSSSFSISLGAGWFAKFAVSCSLNSFQFVMWKFRYEGGWLWAAWMSIMVWISTWSVPGPRRQGQVSHLVIDSSRLSVQNMLSTLVQFPVTMDCSVGSFVGSVMVMPWSARRDIRSSALCIAVVVNRWLFCSSSHIGWCWLKSPHHSKESVGDQRIVLFPSCSNLSTAVIELEWLQSLYILKIVTLPCGCLICMIVTSFVLLSGTCDHELVSSLVLQVLRSALERC